MKEKFTSFLFSLKIMFICKSMTISITNYVVMGILT